MTSSDQMLILLSTFGMWYIPIMDIQLTNLQYLCDGIMSIWAKIPEECFKYFVVFCTLYIEMHRLINPQTLHIYSFHCQHLGLLVAVGAANTCIKINLLDRSHTTACAI